MFMAIAKRIPDEPSQNVVLDAFDILSGQIPFMSLTSYLSPDLMRLTLTLLTGRVPKLGLNGGNAHKC